MAKKKQGSRLFSEEEKRAAYRNQKGWCPRCMTQYSFEEMEGDHMIPWSEDGPTEPYNLQMLCQKCNREKGDS